jgi:hypothetical protein
VIIQTIGLDASGAIQADAEHPTRHRKVEGAAQRSQQVSIDDLRALLWIEHQMQNLAIVLDSCQSRCQSTSHNQTGLWRPGWIRHLT